MSRSIAPPSALTGVRVGLVGERSRSLTAIEEHLLALGATVERVTFAALDRPAVRELDAIVVSLSSAAHGQVHSAQAARERAYVESFAREQRVIGLVDDAEQDSVPGLRDFVLPPFHPSEVSARLSRVLLEPRSAPALRAGNLEVNVVNRTVLVDGRAVDLTFQEFELLRALIEVHGRVLTREVLARELGAAEAAHSSRRVDIHVHRLRAKLLALQGARIETVRQVGYRLSTVEA